MNEETKQIDEGGPAYPVPMWTRQADGQPMAATEYGLGGMTRRQWLAGMAMQGLFANPALFKELMEIQMPQDEQKKAIAAASYQMADAMLAAEKGATK